MKQDVNFLKKSLIAHRGMHNINEKIPENSLKSFEKAIYRKYIIELDVRILKDNSVIVFHDDNLYRMTGVNKKVRDCTYEEIKRLKLQNTENYIVLLEEALKFISGKVPIIIELKSDVLCRKLEKSTIHILKHYNGKYAVKSFNPISVYWLRKNSPEIVRGQLSCDFNSGGIFERLFLKNMFFNFITKPDFVSYELKSLPNKTVERFKKRKLVLGWTIKNKKDLDKAKKYCDNFICDNIDKL